jgi:hypothetical protein
MAQSSNAIKGRLGKALTLFVSMPLLSMPAAAQETNIRARGRIASGFVGAKVSSGDSKVSIRGNELVGFRAKQETSIRARDVVGTKVRDAVRVDGIKTPTK